MAVSGRQVQHVTDDYFLTLVARGPDANQVRLPTMAQLSPSLTRDREKSIIIIGGVPTSSLSGAELHEILNVFKSARMSSEQVPIVEYLYVGANPSRLISAEAEVIGSRSEHPTLSAFLNGSRATIEGWVDNSTAGVPIDQFLIATLGLDDSKIRVIFGKRVQDPQSVTRVTTTTSTNGNSRVDSANFDYIGQVNLFDILRG